MGSESDDVAGLVSRAASGDREAADELVRRYEGPVRAEVHRRLGAALRVREDTDDLVQSTLVAAVRDLQGFEYRSEAAFRAWLVTIAERQVRMAGRFHRRARRDARRETLPPSVDPAASVTSPSVSAARGEASTRLKEALTRLPPEERRVVELHSLEGLGFAETAARAGLPDKDAARYLFRKALKRMGSLLSE